MKTFVASVCVMIIMLSGIGFYINYVNDTTDELKNIVRTISDLSKKGDWEGSIKKSDELVKLWKENEKILCSFTDHEDLDEIKQSISNLTQSVNYKSPENTAVFSSVLIVLIDRLTENEMPKLENILSVQARQNGFLHNML